ncbi:MAG: glycosyltransferase family 4 protein [bacterium]|nr:glycosyltransferase family 4 protein [bacterium]
MKVLFCPAHFVFDEYEHGSEQTSTFTIADRLILQHPSSVVVTGTKNVLTNKSYRIIELRSKKKQFQVSLLESLLFNCQYTWRCYRLIRSEKFDIIHHIRPFAYGSTFNLIPLLHINRKIPFIIGAFASPYTHKDVRPRHENVLVSYLHHLIITMFWFVTKRLSVWTLQRADRVIVYDNYTKKLVSRHILEDKITIIPPGKDKTKFSSKQVRTLTRLDQIHLLSIGYLSYRKGFDITIKAFQTVLNEYPNSHLKIVGEGQERAWLEKYIHNLGLSNNISIAGFIENRHIHHEYNQADLFIHMARAESYAQIYIEALASGLPIISSDNLAARQILQNKDIGIIVPQGNWLALATKIIYLIKNKEVRQNMSVSARQYFEENYDWDNVIIPKYNDVYSSVTSIK